MSGKDPDFEALRQKMIEAVRQVPAGPDRFWRIDA